MIVNGPVVVGIMLAIVLAGALAFASTADPVWSDRKRERVLARRAAMRRHPASWAQGQTEAPPRPAWADLRRDMDRFTQRTDSVIDAFGGGCACGMCPPLRVVAQRLDA